MRQLNVTEADAQLYGRLANSVLYANSSLRADPGVLIRNRRGQSGLWSYAISGDVPIVLLQIGDSANIDLVRQLVQAHAYWRSKGLTVDLMIWKLADSDCTVRRCAARALGRLGPRAEKAVPALLCAEGDEDPSVREAVTLALHRILPQTAMLMARSDQ